MTERTGHQHLQETGEELYCADPDCGLWLLGPFEWENGKPYHRRCLPRVVARETWRKVQAPPDPRRPAEVDSSAMQTCHLVMIDFLENHNQDTSVSLADALLEAVYAYEWAKANAHTEYGFTEYPSLQDARAAVAVWREARPSRTEV